jgi:hypothetical protein
MAYVPPGPTQQDVLVRLEKSQVQYLREILLVDDLRTHGGAGAATVIRKLVADAIAAHKREQATLRARLSVHVGVDRRKLMAGR